MKRLFLSLLLCGSFVLGASLVCGATGSEEPYAESDSYVQDMDAEDSEEGVGQEEEDTEDAEPEVIVLPPPNWDVKYGINRQLQDTGLVFDPYAPADGAEAAPKQRSYEEFPIVEEPIVLIPDEKENAETETKNEEEGEDNDNNE